jgi:hypothetical protein
MVPSPQWVFIVGLIAVVLSASFALNVQICSIRGGHGLPEGTPVSSFFHEFGRKEY